MSLSPADIRIIIDALQDSDWDQASVVIGEVRISVARNGLPLEGEAAQVTETAAAPVPRMEPAPAPAAVPAAVEDTAAAQGTAAVAGAHVVASPSVGVFWRAPQPGAAPFVEVGQRVEAGETVGIVEVMKLMNNIAADASGEVVGIHVANAGAVEFGTPLVSIRADS